MRDAWNLLVFILAIVENHLRPSRVFFVDGQLSFLMIRNAFDHCDLSGFIYLQNAVSAWSDFHVIDIEYYFSAKTTESLTNNNPLD